MSRTHSVQRTVYTQRTTYSVHTAYNVQCTHSVQRTVYTQRTTYSVHTAYNVQCTQGKNNIGAQKGMRKGSRNICLLKKIIAKLSRKIKSENLLRSNKENFDIALAVLEKLSI